MGEGHASVVRLSWAVGELQAPVCGFHQGAQASGDASFCPHIGFSLLPLPGRGDSFPNSVPS